MLFNREEMVWKNDDFEHRICRNSNIELVVTQMDSLILLD